MVGKIDSLTGVRFAFDPAHSRTAEHFCDRGQNWNRDLFHSNHPSSTNKKGLTIFNDPNRGYKEGAKLPHPPVITKEVVHRGVVSQSGKPLRLSDNMAMFKEVKVTEAE